MDTGEHDLPVPMVEESFHLGENRGQGHTAAAAAGVGDDAIRAEGIASILDFEKGPSPVAKGRKS
jgi:hypothetical protein